MSSQADGSKKSSNDKKSGESEHGDGVADTAGEAQTPKSQPRIVSGVSIPTEDLFLPPHMTPMLLPEAQDGVTSFEQESSDQSDFEEAGHYGSSETEEMQDTSEAEGHYKTDSQQTEAPKDAHFAELLNDKFTKHARGIRETKYRQKNAQVRAPPVSRKTKEQPEDNLYKYVFPANVPGSEHDDQDTPPPPPEESDDEAVGHDLHRGTIPASLEMPVLYPTIEDNPSPQAFIRDPNELAALGEQPTPSKPSPPQFSRIKRNTKKTARVRERNLSQNLGYVDFQELNKLSKQQLERTRIRAVYFGPEGDLRYYESSRASKEAATGEATLQWEQALGHIINQSPEAASLRITKQAAMRTWVLNNPFSYKEHKLGKQRKKQRQEHFRNKRSYIDFNADVTAYNLSPYDFLDVTDRLELGNDPESTLPSATDPNAPLTTLEGNIISSSLRAKLQAEAPAEHEADLGIYDGDTVVTSVQDEDEDVGNIPDGTTQGTEAGLWTKGGNDRESFDGDALVQQEQAPGGVQGKRWVEGYKEVTGDTKLAKLQWLDRCFVYPTIDNPNSNNKVFIQHQYQNTIQMVKGINLTSDVDLTSSIIYEGSVMLGVFTESYTCGELKTANFDKFLKDFHQQEHLSEFIFSLHHQYSLRDGCEDTNHWRLESVSSHAGQMERMYCVHTLSNIWNIDRGSEQSKGKPKQEAEPTEEKAEEKAEETPKAPVDLELEKLAGEDILGSTLFAADDMFGDASPLYIKGNVTYVMVYSKEQGFNEDYNDGVDVLGVVTKCEATNEASLSTRASRRILNTGLLAHPSHGYQSDSTNSTSDDDSDLTETDFSDEEGETDEEGYESDIEVNGELTSIELGAKKKPAESLDPDQAHAGGPPAMIEDDEGPAPPSTAKDKQIQKESADEEQGESSQPFIYKFFMKYFWSMVFFVLAMLIIMGTFVWSSLQMGSAAVTIQEAVRRQRIEYSLVGLVLFCVVVGLLLIVIRYLKDSHQVNTRHDYSEQALDAKDYVVSKENLRTLVDAQELDKYAALKKAKNHRLVVLHCNCIPGYSIENPLETRNTMDTTCGNLTRLADLNLKVKLEINEQVKPAEEDTAEERVGQQWRKVSIRELQEISEGNFDASELSMRVESLKSEKLMRRKWKEHTAKQKPKRLGFSPLVRGIGSALSLVICIASLSLLVGRGNIIGFYLLSALVAPALVGSWENPIAVLFGLFFAMHYGASGGIVGKFFITGYAKGVSPSRFVFIYSMLVTLVPVFFTALHLTGPNIILFMETEAFCSDCEELFAFALPMSIGIVSLTVASTLPMFCSFVRRYHLLALEIITPPSFLLKRILTFYYAMEAVSLRLETCVYIVNVSQPDNRLLLSEINSLAKRFTKGDLARRTEENGFGISGHVGTEANDALWGMIDDFTREDVVISPINPGFKSKHMAVAGATVSGAAYYAGNFYRSSLSGIYNATVAQKEGSKPTQTADANVVDANEEAGAEGSVKGGKQTTGFCRVFCYHLFYWVAIFLEVLLYMPSFALYISVYVIAATLGLLILPIALLFALGEALQARKSTGASGPPKNIVFQFFATLLLLLHAFQLMFFLWAKTIIVLMNLGIKIALVNCCGMWKSQFLLTPRLSLFFFPPLSATDRFTEKDASRSRLVKRKRLFKHVDGGYWGGTLYMFAELPLFPQCTALNLVHVDVKEEQDSVVRGKLRSSRDDTAGLVRGKYLKEVGISR